MRSKRFCMIFCMISCMFYLFCDNFEYSRHTNDGYGRHHVIDIPNGRHSAEQPKADWTAVSRSDINLFAYSALYDGRMLRGRLPVAHVVVVGVWHRLDEPMYCGIWTDESRLSHVSVAQVHAIWKHKRTARSNATFVMHCPLSRSNSLVPKFVSIDRNLAFVQFENSVKIPVEIPQESSHKMNFAICLKAVYDFPGSRVIHPQYLVEWIEINKLLGVEHIYVYNHSMGISQSKIFQYYKEKNYVDIFSHSPVPGYDVSKDPAPDLVSSSNDCMFRFMYSVRKIVHIDTDEIIAPFELKNLQELLTYVAKVNQVPVENSQFEFANQRYFLDDPRVRVGPLFSQDAVRHVTAERPDVRQKSIVDPASCLSINSHFCENVVQGARVIRVPTDIGASLHYKPCRTSRRQNKPSNCSEAFRASVEDLTMRRFHKQLEENVNNAMKEMMK